MKIGVINYGVGNLASVVSAFKVLGAETILIDHPADTSSVDKLVLPGVGNFADCANILWRDGWVDALQIEVLGNKRPFLGICLGMQLLAETGTEGAPPGKSVPGLGFVPGEIKSLRTLGCTMRVPHVGWNEIIPTSVNHNLLHGVPIGTDFYFVHSYAFVPKDPKYTCAICDYGIPFAAIVRNGHVWGTQFHPEKSSRAGFRLLNNFLQDEKC
jgi:glutamine amidotransferase